MNSEKVAFYKVFAAVFMILWAAVFVYSPDNSVFAADEGPPVLDLNSIDFNDLFSEEQKTSTTTNNSSKSSGGTIIAPSSKKSTASSTRSKKSEIEDFKIFPVGFNPLNTRTKITFTLSEDAVIDIKVLDQSGRTVVTLEDETDVEADEEQVFYWNGTRSDGKTLVTPGEYFIELDVMQPDTLASEDEEFTRVNVTYSVVDFEDPSYQPNPDLLLDLSANNNPPTETSNTGPGVLVYSLLGLLGFLLPVKK